MPKRALTFTPGAIVHLAGSVTTLRAVCWFSRETLENNLGYHRGRLAKGWSILLLKQPLTANDFEFGGTLLRSDGRLGLPVADAVADKARPRVHDVMMHEYGRQGYRNLQETRIRSFPSTGDQRIAKLIPGIEHSAAMPPSEQYPMGASGEGYWILDRKKQYPFLVAMTVNEHMLARVPGFSTHLGRDMNYDDRAKLARYLQNA